MKKACAGVMHYQNTSLYLCLKGTWRRFETSQRSRHRLNICKAPFTSSYLAGLPLTLIDRVGPPHSLVRPYANPTMPIAYAAQMPVVTRDARLAASFCLVSAQSSEIELTTLLFRMFLERWTRVGHAHYVAKDVGRNRWVDGAYRRAHTRST